MDISKRSPPKKICKNSPTMHSHTDANQDTTQWPIANWHFWFCSYINTKYFWVVFYSDFFLVPMHNLGGHIVNFIYYNKCSKWGLITFWLKNQFFWHYYSLTILPWYQIHFYIMIMYCRQVLLCILPFQRCKRRNEIWNLAFNKIFFWNFFQKIVKINRIPQKSEIFTRILWPSFWTFIVIYEIYNMSC